MSDNQNLKIALQCAVPLWMLRIQGNGGVTDSDIERVRVFGQVLGEKGDVLMFGSKKKGEAADLFNRLAEAIAVMSFCPGGVKIFGEHWQSEVACIEKIGNEWIPTQWR
jgi:hypothetical protein